MRGVQMLGRPAGFLAVFSLTALVLLPIWINLSPFYLAGITAVVNLGLQGVGIASQFHLHPFAGNEVCVPGIVGGAALFVSTPNRPIRWKVGWITLLVVLSGIMLAIALFLQIHNAYALLLEQLGPARRFPLEQNLLMPWLLSDGLDAVLPLFQPGLYFMLNVVLWLIATQR